MQNASFQGWTLLEAFERTADPARWQAYASAKADWERERIPRPSGPGSFIHSSPAKIESVRLRAVEAYESVQSSLRELLIEGRLTAYGSRNGPSEIPTQIYGPGWKSLAWRGLQSSMVKERVGTKSKIFNVRIFPILHSPHAPTALNGSSLADAFRKYVIEDPEVVALGKRVMTRHGHRDVFEKGQAPGPFVVFHWPLGLNADEIAWNFIRPVAFFDTSKPPEPPSEIVQASIALADRCRALQRLLVDGRITATGTFTQLGTVLQIDRMQWKRSGVTIEVRDGDLCEGEGHRAIVRWSGVTLGVPYVSATPAPTRESVTDAADAPAVMPVSAKQVSKTTAVRESIREAVQALWPNGVPPRSLELQQRDNQIIDWQRKHKRKVVSQKSIRRHLSASGHLR